MRSNNMVGAAGLEPTTSCTQNRRATRLRHAPTARTGRTLWAQAFRCKDQSQPYPALSAPGAQPRQPGCHSRGEDADAVVVARNEATRQPGSRGRSPGVLPGRNAATAHYRKSAVSPCHPREYPTEPSCRQQVPESRAPVHGCRSPPGCAVWCLRRSPGWSRQH
jgi:hypothetical protein